MQVEQCKPTTLSKMLWFHLIFWCGNFVERRSFRIGDSPETMRKLCLSTKFSHQKIRWNHSILRSASCSSNQLSSQRFVPIYFIEGILSLLHDCLKMITYTWKSIKLYNLIISGSICSTGTYQDQSTWSFFISLFKIRKKNAQLRQVKRLFLMDKCKWLIFNSCFKGFLLNSWNYYR